MSELLRREAAQIMNKHKPENLGQFFECCEAEGFDDDRSGEMWTYHLSKLQDAGYRALAGLKPLD